MGVNRQFSGRSPSRKMLESMLLPILRDKDAPYCEDCIRKAVLGNEAESTLINVVIKEMVDEYEKRRATFKDKLNIKISPFEQQWFDVPYFIGKLKRMEQLSKDRTISDIVKGLDKETLRCKEQGVCDATQFPRDCIDKIIKDMKEKK